MRFTEQIKNRSGCLCWDCLRRDGLTPPLALRKRHRLYPSDKEMSGPGIDEPALRKEERDDG